MKLTAKKILLQLGGYMVSIAPICVVVGLNWDRYTATTASSVSLGVGGGMALIFILLKALGKIPEKTKPIIKYSVAFAFVLCLEPILADLKWLLGAAVIGETLDLSVFSWQIAKTKKQIDAGITATATANSQTAQTEAIVGAINALKINDTDGRS